MKSVGTQVFSLTGGLLSVSFSSFVYPWLQDLSAVKKKKQEKNHTFSPFLFIKLVSGCFKSDLLYRKCPSPSEPGLVKVFNGRGPFVALQVGLGREGKTEGRSASTRTYRTRETLGSMGQNRAASCCGERGPRPSGWASADR